MAFEISPDGFDGQHRLNFDSLGKLYISIVIIWTTLVICGSYFLLQNRHLPTLRVRNTYLWTTAVAFLHAYWVLCLLAYVINGTYPCTAEFWIMSLWLPFGIALYQVNGMHLLHIAGLQTRFIYGQPLIPSIAWQFFWAWIYAPYLLWKVREIHDLHGWRLQTIICCIAGLPGSPMWLLALYSPEFSAGLAKASRYFGPPLWFTPGIVAMEISVILVPCIMVLKGQKLKRETLRQLLEWERKQDAGTSVGTGSTYVATIDDTRASSPTPSTAPIRSELYSMKALETALTTNINPLLRFSALKDFSGENISFLKHVQDWKSNWTTTTCTQSSIGTGRLFTKKSCALVPESDSLHRRQFALAVEIYVSFISSAYSDFPINISSQQSKDLDSILSHAASTLDCPTQEKNSATPFDFSAPPSPHPGDDIEHQHRPRPRRSRSSTLTRQHSSSHVAGFEKDTEKDAISIASTALTSTTVTTTHHHQPFHRQHHPRNDQETDSTGLLLVELEPRLSRDVAIPLTFGPCIFDEAEREIKYTVLTNTWPRFVREGGEAGRAAAAATGDLHVGEKGRWFAVWNLMGRV